jgi:hypothetical protein
MGFQKECTWLGVTCAAPRLEETHAQGLGGVIEAAYHAGLDLAARLAALKAAAAGKVQAQPQSPGQEQGAPARRRGRPRKGEQPVPEAHQQSAAPPVQIKLTPPAIRELRALEAEALQVRQALHAAVQECEEVRHNNKAVAQMLVGASPLYRVITQIRRVKETGAVRLMWLCACAVLQKDTGQQSCLMLSNDRHCNVCRVVTPIEAPVQWLVSHPPPYLPAGRLCPLGPLMHWQPCTHTSLSWAWHCQGPRPMSQASPTLHSRWGQELVDTAPLPVCPVCLPTLEFAEGPQCCRLALPRGRSRPLSQASLTSVFSSPGVRPVRAWGQGGAGGRQGCSGCADPALRALPAGCAGAAGTPL